MNNYLLYSSTVLIWGSTWLAIKFQLGVVDPMVSVSYRFALAAVLLLGYCKAMGLRMRFNTMEHLFMALQGLLLFSFNYWFVYLAEVHLTSGLVAVIFSTIIFMNIINGRLMLAAPIRMPMVIGAIVGLLGLGLIFLPEISAFNLTDKGFKGLLLVLQVHTWPPWETSFQHGIKNMISRSCRPMLLVCPMARWPSSSFP